MTVMILRIFLAVTALMYAAFGLWSISDPVGMTAALGVDPGGPNGVFEARGIYGGTSLGAAALTAFGAFNPTRMARPALWFLVAYMGGYVIGRAASVIAGDNAEVTSWMFAGGEALVFVIASAFLIRKP